MWLAAVGSRCRNIPQLAAHELLAGAVLSLPVSAFALMLSPYESDLSFLLFFAIVGSVNGVVFAMVFHGILRPVVE